MATAPTAEDSARRILDLFVNHFNRRADSALRMNNFTATWFSDGWNADDFNTGLQFALDAGWVVPGQHDSIVLTDAGFAEA